MINLATGERRPVYLMLAAPNEAAEFVSIPGTQPSLDWRSFGLSSSSSSSTADLLNSYHIFPGGAEGVGGIAAPVPLLFPFGAIPQMPPVLPVTTASANMPGGQGQTMSTIKIDPSLLLPQPVTGTTLTGNFELLLSRGTSPRTADV